MSTQQYDCAGKSRGNCTVSEYFDTSSGQPFVACANQGTCAIAPIILVFIKIGHAVDADLNVKLLVNL